MKSMSGSNFKRRYRNDSFNHLVVAREATRKTSALGECAAAELALLKRLFRSKRELLVK